tara:strand:- start:3640 stop:4992 length:1353 start_codon:yes stop_codon:yes gene_type:complete
MSIIPKTPTSIESEKALLGSLIIDSESWEKISNLITPSDFYDGSNRDIFTEIYDLQIHDQPLDILILEESLKSRDKLSKIGGIEYLKELAKTVPTSAHIVKYAEIVREKSVMRKLIGASTRTIENIHQEEEDIKAILDKAEADIFSIASDSKNNEGLVKIGPIVNDMVDSIYNKKNNNIIDYLLTGYSKLDDIMGGLQNSDLIVIAARPSMGKTALAMNIAQDIVFKQKKKVGFFSLEMSSQSIALRMLSSLSAVEFSKIRTGDYESSNDDTRAVTQAIEMMQDCSMYVDDTGSITPMTLRSRARRMKRESGIDMIILDYLQLMTLPDKSENRVNEIASITRQLKSLAKELDIPIIALSQLNRSLEQRNDKRPFLSDLRESGSIEQDADVVMFIYRDDVYNPNSEDKNIAEINIAKHRNGPTGTAKLTFRSHCTRFEDYHPQIFENTDNL